MDACTTTTPHRCLYHHSSLQTLVELHLKCQLDPCCNLHHDEKKKKWWTHKNPVLIRLRKCLFATIHFSCCWGGRSRVWTESVSLARKREIKCLKDVKLTALMCRIATIITLNSLAVPTSIQLADKNKMGCNSIQTLHQH